MPGELPIPEMAEVDLGTVLSALADPHRRAVVLELLRGDGGERACSSFPLPLAKSTRTHHWKVLRQAGLVRQRDAGNGTFVRLRHPEFEAKFPGLLDVVAGISTAGSTPVR
ncbi:helix-turn-helix transcriptional regulator [Amycolatopsis sp. DG1A-15b]|uniref:ArsR/SmtB family transcription factor n=1 Tax=Amycolatopsis sp. DG1A-15b TaxID=3052846 RepID=UPI00255B8BAC|nr:helix-turn-helix transcriptional regulator [Amycolatopsis sp. DG1A-15b]WIX87244.1 helix-turn-helix transcriptional regulator [Amycolatopsis sp. DG1A-15b]